MTSIHAWSTTAGSNGAVDPAINWQEGQDPSTVNDSARAMMGRVAEWRTDVTASRASTGTGVAYAVTAASAPTTLPNGYSVTFEVHATNTGAATLAVNAYGAFPLRGKVGQALRSGELAIGTIATAYWRAASTEWLLTNSGVLVGELGPALIPAFEPQGRLTLQTGVPVMTGNTSAATMAYTPYKGSYVPIFDGTRFVMINTGGELFQTLADTSKSPAAAIASSNYDYFVWLDAGVPRLSRGPAWISNSGRGSGAGTTQLNRLGGWLVNAFAITNGPAANLGTYVGTIRTMTTGGFVEQNIGGSNVPARFGVWNAYHRKPARGVSIEPTLNWSYTTSAWRLMNNNINISASFVCGLEEDVIEAVANTVAFTTSTSVSAAIGLDTAASPAAECLFAFMSGSGSAPLTSTLKSIPIIGFHNVYAIEYGSAGGSFRGSSTASQSGIALTVWC